MAFNNKENIEKLRNLVRQNLLPLINNNYVLLDVPNHRNIGDLLIWEGELEFLKESKYKLNYTSNVYTHLDSNIKKDDVILLHGGGNFGDVWRLNQDFRNNIIKKFRKNRIIIFPQTIHYHNESFINEDAAIFASHPDLVICARDQVSYDFAKKHFYSSSILMLPDMAFFLDFQRRHQADKKSKSLILKRLDKELGSESQLKNVIRVMDEKANKYEIKDWPGFIESGKLKRRIQYYFIKGETVLSKFMVNKPILNLFVDDKHGLKGKNYKEKLIEKGVRFINEYDTVYSTRLHGFILSVLLNKEVYIFDNSYGKNKNFFNTWLKDFEKVELIES